MFPFVFSEFFQNKYSTEHFWHAISAFAIRWKNFHNPQGNRKPSPWKKYQAIALHKKWIHPLKISSVNVFKSPLNGHIFQQTCSWKLYYLSIHDRLVQVRSYLLKISLMENSIFWTDDKSVEAATCGSSTENVCVRASLLIKLQAFWIKLQLY